LSLRTPPNSVFVMGESLVDVVSSEGRIVEHLGGSPLNVAYGLGRLGVPTALRTSLGSDARGHEVAAHLTNGEVRLDPESWGEGATSSATATIDADGSASYKFDIVWAPGPMRVPLDAAIVHTGSIAAVLAPGADDVFDAFVSSPSGVIRSLDPNVRPSIVPDRPAVEARIEAMAGVAHVVKLSDEDAAWLYPELEIEGVLDRFLGLGAALAVVTRGSEGCIAASPVARIVRPSHPVSVVDTIGAGDSFMSGILAAILQNRLSEDVLAGSLDALQLEAITEMALSCASITVARAGAQPPTSAELAAVGS
jgi:fructokinase